jgi:tetratricopeptide (TPR) repeat protein
MAVRAEAVGSKAPGDLLKQAEREYFECQKASLAGQMALAESHGQMALKLLEPFNDRLKFYVCLELCNLEAGKGKGQYAEELAEKAVVAAEKSDGISSLYYLQALGYRAMVYARLRQWAMAESKQVDAIASFERVFAKEHEGGAAVLSSQLQGQYDLIVGGLVCSLAAQGKDDEAMNAAVKLLKATGNKKPSDFDLYLALASAKAHAGELHYKAGEIAKAEPLLEKSIKLYEQWKSNNPEYPVGESQLELPYPSIQAAMGYLAEIYEKSGKPGEGAKLRKAAKEYQDLKDSLHGRQ